MTLLIRNARVLTLTGSRPRCGAALADLGVTARADVLIEGERIVSVAPSPITPHAERDGIRSVDADGRVLMPAFIDCHTHACWAGDRLDEWAMRLRGVPYLDVLKSGGGIMSTVRAVRDASQRDLEEMLLARLDTFLEGGTATIEIKSGYGLSTDDELKMLRAIHAVRPRWPGTIIATALLGHAIDADIPEFVERTTTQTLDAVHDEFPGITIDAFCEQGAWSREQCVALFERARALGHPIRIHSDQFNSLGMIPEAVRLGAISVDHLEASTDADLQALAASGTFGVILPICGLHMDNRYANARRFIDAGGRLALATNCNPGSAPSASMPLAIAAAVRHCRMTPSEAIAACTLNAAALLRLPDLGAIAPGQRADLILLRHRDERMLAYEMGGNPVDEVLVGGKLMAKKA